MLEVHSKDYFSLKYDAAAQNRVTSLSGKDYTRGLTEQQITKKLTEAIVATGKQVSLPYGPLLSSSASTGYDYKQEAFELTGWSQFAASSLKPAYFYQAMHSEDLERSEGAELGTKQFLLFADFEVFFTDLNLPANTYPEVSLAYETEKFQFGANINSSSTTDRSYLSNAFKDSGTEPGYIDTSDWSNIWMGAGLAETSERDRRLTYDSYPNDLSNLRNDVAYKVESFRASLGRRTSSTDKISQKVRGIEESYLENVVKTAASTELSTDWFKGAKLRVGTVTSELLDRDTFKVGVHIPIYNASVGYTHLSNTTWYEFANRYEWLKSLNVTIKFPQMSWTGVPFEYATEEGNEFPYKFQNTQVANAADKVGEHLWSEYYPKMILDKYKEGKHYIELKVRVGFMLQNDIHVDTKLKIYDLKNKVISRNGVPCIFKVKRILKSFSNNEFYYIINCLED